eukprot:CAMPEP_0182536668 /NCGR_PEP_ID=MMETSP1323-20130603/20553_1 /TAXON_ID=236787 /ORGANISM="Florenciella parvula, Strain RCC1693" /LENGTH=98 /DNA_ID=CAMNT_0024746937 /DNA_START=50 /DNA_END=343 /DNA_ORIENTATION=+
MVWGANTDVGKTLISAGMCRTAGAGTRYLKPAQTGYPPDSDAETVRRLAALPERHLEVETLHAWRDPVSPHLAARREGWSVDDDALAAGIEGWLRGRA